MTICIHIHMVSSILIQHYQFLNGYILSIDGILTVIATLDQSGSGSNDNEGVTQPSPNFQN